MHVKYLTLKIVVNMTSTQNVEKTFTTWAWKLPDFTLDNKITHRLA